MINISSADISSAIGGNKDALETLLLELWPVIRSRVLQTLIRHRYRAKGRSLAQEVDDFIQQTIMYLIEKDCRVLGAWDPDKGMSLENFIGLVTVRYVTKIVSRDKNSPWTEDPTSLEMEKNSEGEASRGSPLGAEMAKEGNPEELFSQKEILTKILEQLRRNLTPLGFQLFHMICVQSLSVGDICGKMSMSPEAVYAWRSRLTKTVEQITEDLLSETNSRLATKRIASR